MIPPVPIFTPNYPIHQPGAITLLSTPERTGALPEYTGRDVVIGFIDAGFYTHPDLDGRILAHVDASTRHVVEQSGSFHGSDLSWHGQMTSVIAAGDGYTSGGKYRGIASNAKLVLVKVSTPKGHIKETDILRGLRWIIDTHRRFNIRIVNISVGGDVASNDPNHPLHKAIRSLAEAGVTVVVAAGNRSTGSLVPPASAAQAITVGGLDDCNSFEQSLWKLYHHSYGIGYDGTPKPELIAPAAWLPSPIMPDTSVAREASWLAPLLEISSERHLKKIIRSGYTDLGFTEEAVAAPDEHLYALLQQRIHAHKIIDAHHQHVDGTSVAAPIVSSVIAQMLEANPGLTTQQIRDILTNSATPLPGAPAEKQGSGILNAPRAVVAALNFA